MTAEFDTLDRASGQAVHRLRELKMFGREAAKEALDYITSRPRHRKGLGCRTTREFLKLDGGAFCLHYTGKSTEVWVRWIEGDNFLVKTIWTDAWPECKDDGEVEYEVKEAGSAGHYLDHVVTAYSEPTVLFREGHFDETAPSDSPQSGSDSS